MVKLFIQCWWIGKQTVLVIIVSLQTNPVAHTLLVETENEFFERVHFYTYGRKKLGQKDTAFEASLGFTVRPCLQN